MALLFDGVDDQVDHGDINAMDGAPALSWSFWLNLDIFVSQKGIVMKGANIGILSSEGSEVANSIGVFFAVANRVYAPAGALGIGALAHWGIIYNGGGATNPDKLKIRKNGVDQAINVFAGAIPATFPSTTGALTVMGGNGFTAGKMAHLKVWSANLTPAEMDQEMHSYRPVRTANLVLRSPYDDGVSARDYSGGSQHGTVAGAVQIAGPPVAYGG